MSFVTMCYNVLNCDGTGVGSIFSSFSTFVLCETFVVTLFLPSETNSLRNDKGQELLDELKNKEILYIKVPQWPTCLIQLFQKLCALLMK